MRRRIFAEESLWLVIGFFLFGVLTLLLAGRHQNDLRLLGFVEILMAIAAVVIGVFASRRKKRILVERLESFSFCTEAATRAAVLTFPAPMVVTDISGSVQWYNQRFQTMLGREEMFGEYFQDNRPTSCWVVQTLPQ